MESASRRLFDSAPPGEVSPGVMDTGHRSHGWLWTALAIGIAAALVNAALSQFIAALRNALITNQIFYLHQSAMNAVGGVVGALFAPALAIVFALLYLRASSGATLRRRAWATAASALLAIVLLAACEQLVVVFSTPGIIADRSQAEVTTLLNELTAITSGLASFALAIGLVFAVGALTASRASTRHSPRLRDWALTGALVGVVTSAFAQSNRVILLTVTAVRLAQVGAFACMADSGASCFPRQMLDVGLYSLLPALVGAAIGGMIGGALASRTVASQTAVGAFPSLDEAGDAPSRRRSRHVIALQYAAAAVIGALYAAYTLALQYANIQHPYISGQSTARTLRDAFWISLVACLALAVPALWLALIVTVHRRTATPTDSARRALVRWLVLLALVLAVATPASVLLFPGLNFGVGMAAIILAAFAVGAICGLIWSPPSRARRPRSPWMTGLLATAPVWIGFSLVAAVVAGAALYSASQPPGPGSATCHGLGCGALLLLILNVIAQLGVNYVLYGLPAALFGGGLSALIRAKVAR